MSQARNAQATQEKLARDLRTLQSSLTGIEANLAQLLTRVANVEAALDQRLWVRFQRWLPANWLTAIGVSAGVLAIPVMIVLFWLPRHEQHVQTDLTNLIDHQFDQKMRDNKFDELRTDVATLTGQMKTFIPLLQDAVHQELTKAASLPASQFQNNLTRVNVALTAAKLTNASIPSSIINDLRSKLIQVSRSTPYYWGTATALVGYRSVQLPESLPNCFDKTPLMTTQQDIPKEMHYPFDLKITPPTYENCKVDLSQSPPQNVADYLKWAPKLGVEFKQSLVIYKAGVIPLLNLAPRLTFTNCAFQISPRGAEDEPGRKLVNDLLLAQNPAAITVNGKAGE
jgi:hypothetical protein